MQTVQGSVYAFKFKIISEEEKYMVGNIFMVKILEVDIDYNLGSQKRVYYKGNTVSLGAEDSVLDLRVYNKLIEPYTN